MVICSLRRFGNLLPYETSNTFLQQQQQKQQQQQQHKHNMAFDLIACWWKTPLQLLRKGIPFLGAGE
jgi:hypothetical protein